MISPTASSGVSFMTPIYYYEPAIHLKSLCSDRYNDPGATCLDQAFESSSRNRVCTAHASHCVTA
jgi:hypothetical protein